MPTFLQRIAKAYCNNVTAAEMADMCFVLPNKRSGAFFRKALQDYSDPKAPRIEPEITTIADFVAELSETVRASRFELLFTLFDEYKRLSADVDDFDKFVFWGDMLLADFNDADMYMADTDNLFRNLRDMKEISADYLTEEQRDVISRYWNLPIPIADPDRFWNHVRKESEPRTNRDSFVRLWEILQPLHASFCRNLEQRGLSYSGRQYREVARRLAPESDNRPEIPYTRVIFIGFNVLSVSEVKIFEGIARAGIADFYWDTEFPTEMSAVTAQATTFVRRYARAFPSRYDIGSTQPLQCPDITIASVPSAVGQVKYAGAVLGKMVSDHRISNPANAINTAVILPAENLFIDLLHSLPESLTAVNITMGYPLRLTSVAQLIRSVTSMHLRASKVAGRWCFFYEDVAEVLASPLLTSVLGNDCESLRQDIESKRLFSIPVDYISETTPRLSPVFYPVSDLRDAESVFGYSLQLVDFLSKLLDVHRPDAEEESDDDNSEIPPEIAPGMPAENLELGFLFAYRRALESLLMIARRHGIRMHESTFFQLIERTVGPETVNFVGEPLHGLQIMGVLETRVLSFDNLIMLSMNERVFPQHHISRSFIPEILRRCYGMSTTEFQECVFAYHFYRLIAGAKNVTLVYDTRTQGISSGDMSRYLYQLIYMYPARHMRIDQVSYEMPTVKARQAVSIEKTPRIMAEIARYKSSGNDARYLSASSINELVACPLNFYFKHIEHLKVADDIVEYMDEGLFGTIMHEVAEKSYLRFKNGSTPLMVTSALLDRLISEKTVLQKLITDSINRHFNKLPSQASEGSPYTNATQLVGEAKVIGNVMLKLMNLLFKEEKKRAPFEFISAEQPVKNPVVLGSHRINLTGSIDRVDRMTDGTISIIDYKTGDDNIDIRSLDHLLTPVSDTAGHEKAILQLFVYCNAYCQITGYKGPIKPRLFRFRKLASEGLGQITIEKQPLDNYLDFNDEVMKRIDSVLDRLFNPDVPFTAAPHKSHCRYCKYGQLCGQAKK